MTGAENFKDFRGCLLVSWGAKKYAVFDQPPPPLAVILTGGIAKFKCPETQF